MIGVCFFDAYLSSDLFGKSIFWSLFFLSVLSWFILAQKIYYTKKIRSLCYLLDQDLEAKKESLFKLNFSHLLKGDFSFPYYEIFKLVKQKTLEVLDKNRFFIKDEKVYLSKEDVEMISSYAEATLSQQIKRLEKNIFILPTVVTLAPFLGLLGTVWGILVTFSNLQVTSLFSTNTTVLSGLSMALATTVVGLIVAIPALVGYNFLKSAIKDFTQDMENFSQRLILCVEMHYRKAK